MTLSRLLSLPSFYIYTKPLHYARVVRELRDASAHYKVNPASLVRAFLALRFAKQFSSVEIFRYGLLAPAPAAERAYRSKEWSLELLRRLNPSGHACLVEDKTLFYKYAQGLGLPVPALLAVLEREGPFRPDGRRIRVPDDWEIFLRTEVPDQFVMKPAMGVYAREFAIMTRVQDRYEDSRGVRSSAREVSEKAASGEYDRFLLQERLRDHPELSRLSDSKGVQSLRLNTVIDDRGEPRLLFYMLKVIRGDNLTDNFDGGRTGNLIAVGEPDSGTLRYAYTLDASGFGMRRVDAHPVTGRKFAGFEVPFWREARDLVCRAAPHFLPLRAIGWDVAVTAEGPKLLEGNVWWDPTNYAPELLPDSGWDMLERLAR